MKRVHELGDLFEADQLQNIFENGKTFSDCLSKRSLDEIVHDYEKQRDFANFDFKKFVLQNFSLPESASINYQSDASHSGSEPITELWKILARKPENEVFIIKGKKLIENNNNSGQKIKYRKN